MYIDEKWLLIAGVFLCGMLFMLGILIWVDSRKKARRPRQVMGLGFDPDNPMNRRHGMGQDDREWFEVRPDKWR